MKEHTRQSVRWGHNLYIVKEHGVNFSTTQTRIVKVNRLQADHLTNTIYNMILVVLLLIERMADDRR